MGKLIVIPSSKEMIYNLSSKVDGFIIGINKLSVNLPVTFTLDETIEIIKYLNDNDKEIFISLNKNMFNKDLDNLTKIMKELSNYHVTAIMYYDISIVNLNIKSGFNFDLVWAQEHLTTNGSTTNFWYNRGVKYTYLSSEITKREIEEIKKETKSLIMVNLFGYLPIFTSGRHLVDNYLKTFNKEKQQQLFFMEKEDKIYPVVDNEEGTVTYSNFLLNGIKEVTNNIDYIVLNSFLIDNFENIIDIFKKAGTDNLDESYNEINDLINNTSDGFLYKETIYKVK